MHRPGCGADLLRRARAVPRAAGADLGPGPGRPGRRGHRHRAPGDGAARRGRHPGQRDPAHPRGDGVVAGRRLHVRHRSRRRAVVGLGVRRRVLPGDEPGLRDLRGPPVLEAAPRDAARHPHRRLPRRHRPRDARGLRPRRGVHRRRDRPRGPGTPRLGPREVARARLPRDVHRGAALLRHPQRPAAQVPLDLGRCRRRHRHLGAGLGRLRVLRRQLRQLRQDLRLPGRRHRRPAVAVDHQHRAAVRRRGRLRDGAGSRAAGRHGGRGGAPAARPRHPQHREGAREGARGHRARATHPRGRRHRRHRRRQHRRVDRQRSGRRGRRPRARDAGAAGFGVTGTGGDSVGHEPTHAVRREGPRPAASPSGGAVALSPQAADASRGPVVALGAAGAVVGAAVWRLVRRGSS